MPPEPRIVSKRLLWPLGCGDVLTDPGAIPRKIGSPSPIPGPVEGIDTLEDEL